MKIIRVIGFIIALLALGYYGYQIFGMPNGKKYKVNDKHHVYYKGDGVTEEDAKKVGDYFTGIGLFGSDNEMDVQIVAEKDQKEIKIKYVVDKNKITSDAEAQFLQLSKDMGARLFPEKNIRVVLVDDHLDDIKDLGLANSTQPPANNPGVNQTGDEK